MRKRKRSWRERCLPEEIIIKIILKIIIITFILLLIFFNLIIIVTISAVENRKQATEATN